MAELSSCREAQREELELLSSMFNIPDELEFLDTADQSITLNKNEPNRLEEVETASYDDDSASPEFLIKLEVNKHQPEISFCLPPLYPNVEKPVVFVRCSSLNSYQCLTLNCKLRQSIDDAQLSLPLVNQCLMIIRDLLESVVTPDLANEQQLTLAQDQQQSTVLCRYWIYSHHIYSKIKRRNILSLTGQLSLNGFCLSGKPAIICIQGKSSDCSAFWDEIKSWSWQRIVVKWIETLDEKEQNGKTNTVKLFDNFSEISMDMRDVKKLLDQYECGSAFYKLFDLEEKGK